MAVASTDALFAYAADRYALPITGFSYWWFSLPFLCYPSFLVSSVVAAFAELGRFTCRLHPARVMFATAVSGVYSSPPPGLSVSLPSPAAPTGPTTSSPLPVISESSFPALRPLIGGAAGFDVTGGMLDKVERGYAQCLCHPRPLPSVSLLLALLPSFRSISCMLWVSCFRSLRLSSHVVYLHSVLRLPLATLLWKFTSSGPMNPLSVPPYRYNMADVAGHIHLSLNVLTSDLCN
jgi:hypothetical protein